MHRPDADSRYSDQILLEFGSILLEYCESSRIIWPYYSFSVADDLYHTEVNQMN